MTGDMTLRCNVSDGRQWNYTWLMNEQQLNASSDVLKVAGNEENIKSEFKCKGINTERPLYSALSDGFIANNISESWEYYLQFRFKTRYKMFSYIVSEIIYSDRQNNLFFYRKLLLLYNILYYYIV